MKLLIISATPHYRRGEEIVGHGATVREINHLSSLFDQVTHIGFLYKTTSSKSALAYTSPDFRFVALEPSGGDTLAAKLGILLHFPGYIRAILRELPHQDMVHVRCPANVSMLAIVLLAFLKKPRIRWVKYGGNWQSYSSEPWSYAFQRWWLRRNLADCQVTVSGAWSDQPDHIHSFDNPCLTRDEIADGRQAARGKQLGETANLLYAGRLDPKKGLLTALEVIAQLHREGHKLRYDIVGAGPQADELTAAVDALGLQEVVHFHGPMTRGDLNKFYARAHFVLLPSLSEGWPKILSEGLAYGAVPIAGAVGSIPSYLEQFMVGRALPPGDVDAFVAALQAYFAEPDQWIAESQRGLEVVERFSYAAYLQRVQTLMDRR